jgi:hypothetical protein
MFLKAVAIIATLAVAGVCFMDLQVSALPRRACEGAGKKMVRVYGESQWKCINPNLLKDAT